ncbi:MAG: hypothetical protein ACK56F_02730, partial [bacterium]
APYCPIDKPIERGFSNVKNYLRSHESQAILSPIEWINNAFTLYSTEGERGGVAYKHFNSFHFNYDLYLNHM